MCGRLNRPALWLNIRRTLCIFSFNLITVRPTATVENGETALTATLHLTDATDTTNLSKTVRTVKMKLKENSFKTV